MRNGAPCMIVASDKNSFFGEESLSLLTQALDNGAHQKVLLITGRDSYTTSGAEQMLAPCLKGREVTRISDFQINPAKADVLRIVEELKSIDYTVIIAVGGGSAMDVAKLIKGFKDQPDLLDAVLHEGATFKPSEIELFAIPTTAGSGSEATHFAVVYDGKVKFSVAHQDLLPTASWMVSKVLGGASSDVKGAAAMDAFSQAVESYWCIHSTDESKQYAQEAVTLLWANMEKALLENDSSAWEKLAYASHLAGKAINISKTTAPHAISYALTAYYGVKHGHGAGLMVPAIWKYNAAVSENDVQDARGAAYVQSTMQELNDLIGCATPEAAASEITQKMQAIGLSTDLAELGISSEADIETVIENGFNLQRVINNPRCLTEEALRNMLHSMAS